MNFAAVTRDLFWDFVDICQSFMPGYRILGGILCDFPRKYRKVLPLSNHWYDAVDLFWYVSARGNHMYSSTIGYGQKIYFPREVIPISYVTSAFVNMLFSFIIVFWRCWSPDSDSI